MVQIREYTQREGLQPVNRGGLNIQKPRAFAEGVGTTISKKPLETMSELAKLGVAMKERRDDAMVSEFINQHSIEATQQINDLQQKYKGLNAHKVLDKYNQWNEEYVAKYSSYDNASDDDDEHVYLENAEQLKKAKEMLSRSHVSTLNSLSNYVGREEETARQNALSATIQSEVERIAQTDIPENIEISKQNIIANLSALYRGQSGEFINQKAKNMMNAAVSGNLMYRAAEDPATAIELFNSSMYGDNMDIKTKKSVRDSLLKMFIEQQSNEVGKIGTGQDINMKGDEFYQTPFFEGLNVESIKQQIEEKGQKIKAENDAKNKEASSILLGGINTDFYEAQHQQYLAKQKMLKATTDEEKAVAARDIAVANDRMAQVTISASAVEGGSDLIRMLNDSENEAITFAEMTKEMEDIVGERSELTGRNLDWDDERKKMWDTYTNRTLDHSGSFAATLDDIMNGEYVTVSSVEDFENYGPEQKRQIIKAIADRQRYETMIANAKAKSPTDFEGKIETLYSDRYGKKKDNPIWYNNFRTDMARYVTEYLAENPRSVPDSKLFQQWADNAGSLRDENGRDIVVRNIVYGAKFDKSNKYRDRDSNIRAIKKSIKNIYIGNGWNPFDNISDDLAQEVAEKIVDNNNREAVRLLRDAGFIGD